MPEHCCACPGVALPMMVTEQCLPAALFNVLYYRSLTGFPVFKDMPSCITSSLLTNALVSLMNMITAGGEVLLGECITEIATIA
jgi:hypothetical protein